MLRLYDKKGLDEYNAYQPLKIPIPKALRCKLKPNGAWKINDNCLVLDKFKFITNLRGKYL